MGTSTKQKFKKFLVRHPHLYSSLYYFKSIATDYKGRKHVKHYGKNNADKTIYLIRPRTNCIEGLMALLVYVLQHAEYADKNNWPVAIDMLNYKTQYWVENKGNVWEWFFDQPSNISLDEVYSSSKVILSGYSFKQCIDQSLFSKDIFFDHSKKDYCHYLFDKYVKYNNDVVELVNQESKKLDIENCIGVFLRGTDFLSLKPVGEPIQPTKDQVFEKVQEFLEKYGNRNIFLVTEEKKYYEFYKEMWGDKLKIVSFDSFIDNYDGSNFLSKTDVLSDDKYHLALHYLVKIILLSKCKYLVSSIASGSKAAYVMNEKYEDEYIFNLGEYQ